jgi:hypothetical protein
LWICQGNLNDFDIWVWCDFFLIELDFFYHLFFSRIVKKKLVYEKGHVIKFHKIYGLVHKFDWLTWFAGLWSLTLFFYFILGY